jgi:hypothetical protein
MVTYILIVGNSKILHSIIHGDMLLTAVTFLIAVSCLSAANEQELLVFESVGVILFKAENIYGEIT